LHYSQLILQLSWQQLSTIMFSSGVQAHSTPTTAIAKRIITCGAQTRLSETKHFHVNLFPALGGSIQISLFIHCDQP
ncbi:hypothetical protein BAE44_0023398, partial [Dichanthelium oligosanthes]